MIITRFLVLLIVDRAMASDQLKLIQDLLDSYDSKAKPTWDNNRPVNVTFSMDLYQLLELVSPFSFIIFPVFTNGTFYAWAKMTTP
jgi:hypothetical protein